MLQNKKIVIFDMDGTLIDSVGIWNQVDEKLLTALHAPLLPVEELQSRRDKLLRKFSQETNPYLEYCRFLKAAYHFELSASQIFQLRYEIAAAYLKKEIDYKEGADQTVKFLRNAGFTLVIASTTRKKNMDIYRKENENILKKASLDQYFTRIYTKEDVERMKPDPEVYLRLLHDFQARPEQCIVFEDSLIGVEAAKNAGIEVIAMYDRYSDCDRENIDRLADYRFQNYNELLRILLKECNKF
ncbi:MAG: HAD family hydrolase [Clostridia bacterium]